MQRQDELDKWLTVAATLFFALVLVVVLVPRIPFLVTVSRLGSSVGSAAGSAIAASIGSAGSSRSVVASAARSILEANETTSVASTNTANSLPIASTTNEELQWTRPAQSAAKFSEAPVSTSEVEAGVDTEPSSSTMPFSMPQDEVILNDNAVGLQGSPDRGVQFNDESKGWMGSETQGPPKAIQREDISAAVDEEGNAFV